MSNAITATLSSSYHKVADGARHVEESVRHGVSLVAGRTVQWYNGTSVGGVFKTAAWGAATAALVAGGITAAIKSVSALAFAFYSITAGAGLAVSVASLGISVALAAVTVLATKVALTSLNHTVDSYHVTRALAALGK